jgi:hypothetical protein
MATQSKPSIVFAHGLFADGSCYSKLIPTLQAEGHAASGALASKRVPAPSPSSSTAV